MGTIISKDTRRISFDNKIAISPNLNLKKPFQDDDILDIGNIEMNPSSVSSKESIQYVGLHEDEHGYWTKRLQKLKNEHELINKIVESEYEKTIESTKQISTTPKITDAKIQKIKPCFDWRHKGHHTAQNKLLRRYNILQILKCYEDNPHQPLVCSPIVQEFRNCVSACSVEH